ncbi:MAG: hypothetical protein RL885_09860, partial [Planctomycetota bacterium]
LNGVVDVHFIYIDGDYWTEFNRYERLTPNDTFTVAAGVHNPNSEQGFMYAVALNPNTQEPMSFNWLIGDEIIADSSGNWLYAFEACAFKSLAAEGQNSDVDDDGMLELDGVEFEAVGDKMLLSSFFGYDSYGINAGLILVALTPSSDYETRIDFQVYNNNEHEFSTTYKFRCWAMVDLKDIDSVFTNDFLESTSYDSRDNGLYYTTGWARLDGDRAIDIVGNEPAINDPAFVGAMFQSLGGISVGHLLHQTEAKNATPGTLDSLQ